MNPFVVAQTVLAVLLIISILFQGRGAGLGGAWGGEGEFYGTRRGVERLLFKVTIVLCALFVVVSIASIVI